MVSPFVNNGALALLTDILLVFLSPSEPQQTVAVKLSDVFYNSSSILLVPPTSDQSSSPEASSPIDQSLQQSMPTPKVPTSTVSLALTSSSLASTSSTDQSKTSNPLPTDFPLFATFPLDRIPPKIMEILNQWASNDAGYDSLSRNTFASSLIAYLLTDLTAEQQAKVTYAWDEVFINCVFNRENCWDPSNFQQSMTATYGACYTFNFDSINRRHSPRSGRQFGLSLVLESNLEDYLCTSTSSGFRFSLQEPNAAGFPETDGFYVNPGTLTTVVITRKINHKIDNCVRVPDRSAYYYEGDYRTEGCMRACYQRYAIRECDCADPRYAKPEGARFCTILDVMCLETVMACQEDQFMQGIDCDCKDPCDFYYYEVTVTTSKLHMEAMILNGACDHMNYSRDSPECDRHINKEIAYVEIFYSGFPQFEYTEQYAYSLLDFLSDAAAFAGLLFNFCVIAVCDLIMFIVLSCFPSLAISMGLRTALAERALGRSSAFH